MLGTQMPAEQRDLVDFSYPVSIASPEATADRESSMTFVAGPWQLVGAGLARFAYRIAERSIRRTAVSDDVSSSAH